VGASASLYYKYSDKHHQSGRVGLFDHQTEEQDGKPGGTKIIEEQNMSRGLDGEVAMRPENSQ